MTTNQVLTCIDCEQQFTLAHGEIEWYGAKAWSAPKRCPHSRKVRRAQRKAWVQQPAPEVK